MKKLLLALILVLLVLPLTACGSGSSGTLEFELVPDDTYRVSGIGTFNGSVLEIPSSYEGKPVTTIHRLAFGCESLTSVTIPDSVKSIGHSAFYMCESLTSVTITDSVKSIGEDAFSSCESLTSVTIPDRATLPNLHPQNNYCTL